MIEIPGADDAGEDGPGGSGGGGAADASHDGDDDDGGLTDANPDGSVGDDDADVDPDADVDADVDADSDGGDDSADGGDEGGDTDGGLDDGGEPDAEPPLGTLELCVLNEGGPFDLCETPEELDFGTVPAGTQRMRLFRLDNETLEDVTFETVDVGHVDFSVKVVRYVSDADDPGAPPAREVVDLPIARPAGTSLYFEVTFTSKGETAGAVPADKVWVTATTASNRVIDVEVPIVGEQEACPEGYAVCDSDPNNGCDTNIHGSLDSCGGCGVRCGFDNATAVCDQGVCKLAQCNPGFEDCNGQESDGCEVNLKSDPFNCNACGNRCDAVHANSACIDGACAIV